jgi:hypothetical protein
MAVNESCRGTCFEVTDRRLRSIVRLMKSTVGHGRTRCVVYFQKIHIMVFSYLALCR